MAGHSDRQEASKAFSIYFKVPLRFKYKMFGDS